MESSPRIIDGYPVVCYSRIDERHRFSEKTWHLVNGEPIGIMAGMAICWYAEGKAFYLFSCDEEWNCVTDTYHGTLDEAKWQAEREYEGIGKTWIEIMQEPY